MSLPSLSTSAELPESELVAVTMSAAAAEQLANACRWAATRAERERDDTRLPSGQRSTAMLAYEWLDWGARWLMYDKARREVHTCHAECPCQKGGEPRPDFLRDGCGYPYCYCPPGAPDRGCAAHPRKDRD